MFGISVKTSSCAPGVWACPQLCSSGVGVSWPEEPCWSPSPASLATHASHQALLQWLYPDSFLRAWEDCPKPPADLCPLPCFYEIVLKGQNIALDLPQCTDQSSELTKTLLKYEEKVNLTNEFSTSSVSCEAEWIVEVWGSESGSRGGENNSRRNACCRM